MSINETSEIRSVRLESTCLTIEQSTNITLTIAPSIFVNPGSSVVVRFPGEFQHEDAIRIVGISNTQLGELRYEYTQANNSYSLPSVVRDYVEDAPLVI